jgi:hypothetical protein
VLDVGEQFGVHVAVKVTSPLTEPELGYVELAA